MWLFPNLAEPQGCGDLGFMTRWKLGRGQGVTVGLVTSRREALPRGTRARTDPRGRGWAGGPGGCALCATRRGC